MENKRIKILHVIGIMDYGGAETMIMNLYRKINREQFQFDFLVHRKREGKYDQEIKQLGGEIYSIPEFKIYNWHSYKMECDAFFKEHNDYDVIHGHIESCASIYLGTARKYGIHTIAHCHSAGYQSMLPKILYNLLTINTRKVAEWCLSCSKEAGLNRFGKKVVFSERFLVFNNGIDTEKYIYSCEQQRKFKKMLGIEDQIVIGHVGRMSKEKNQQYLLHVFKEVLERKKNCVLVLVGDGEEKKYLESLAEKLEIKNKVLFLGNRSDVGDLMKMFDIFVFPSIYEGLPLVLIEAQAADLPCVVSEAIISEAIFTEKVKKLSLGFEYTNWSTEVLTMLEKKWDRGNTYNLICDKGFDINETVMKLESIYKSIVNKM